MNIELSPSRHGFMIRPETAKTCPRCSSFFIDTTGCEECGYIPHETRLGSPYGERSFYALKANYWESAPLFLKLFPRWEFKSSSVAQEYKKFLLLRYRMLLEFFANAKHDHPFRKHFYIELQALVEELLDYSEGKDLLLKTLPHSNEERLSPLLEEIARWVREKKTY